MSAGNISLKMGARRECGFTLVELLIAITLLGLISVVVYSAVWTAGKTLQAVEKRVESSESNRVMLRFLRQALAQSRGVMAIKDSRMQVVFHGETQAIAFVAPAPLQRGAAGGLYRYRLALSEGDSEAGSLQLSYGKYLIGRERNVEDTSLGKVLLSTGVDEMRLSYFGSAEPDKKAQWLEEWPRTDTLPLLVRLMLKYAGDDGTAVMTVAIRGSVG